VRDKPSLLSLQASSEKHLPNWQAITFLFCLIAVSPQLAIAQTNPATFLGSVQGHISCGDGGFPATNAHLTLISVASMLGQKDTVGSLNSSTDFNGDYLFQGVPPGDYVLHIRYPGYVDDVGNVWENFSQYKAEKQKELLAGAPLITVRDGSARFDEVLHRGGAISGRVTFDIGAPVTGASVVATQVSEDLTQSSVELNSVGTWNLRATTDDRGKFRIAGFPKGNYRISVSAHRVNSTIGGAFIVFAPDTFKESEAKLIAIDEGDELDDVDITVPLKSFHSIGGSITRGGAPFPKVELSIHRQGERGNQDVGVASDGKYRVDLLLPGTYVIQASYSLAHGSSMSRSVIVTLSDSDILDANLEVISDLPTR
jgi:hypothetical protein